jgi:hypothetical protein
MFEQIVLIDFPELTDRRVVMMFKGWYQCLLFLWICFALLGGAFQLKAQQRQPYTFFKNNIELSEGEIGQVDKGEPVVKIIDTGEKPEIFIFGAVYVKGEIETFIKNFRQVERLRKSESYLAVKKISTPPQLSDFAGFTLEADDLKDLPECRPGDCVIQLDDQAIQLFHNKINWSSPQSSSEAQRLMANLGFEILKNYCRSGNAALGKYHDKEYLLDVPDVMKTLVARKDFLPTYIPQFHQFLIEYPKIKLPGEEEFFYWEKVKFGLKPTLRLNHVTIYRGVGKYKNPGIIIGNKQLYSSHYFQSAVDFWLTTKDSSNPKRPGFYLITLKGSRQHGLTGFSGNLTRHVILREVRDSMAKALAGIKEDLEKSSATK